MKRCTRMQPRQLSDRQAFWATAMVGVLFVAATDGAILALSKAPFLYGIIEAFSTRFEETLLYLPVIKNFSFFDPLLADFTGPRQIHALAPYPYLSFGLAKILSLASGGSLNGTMIALHLTVVGQLVFAYKLVRCYGTTPVYSLLSSLLLVFAFSLSFFAILTISQDSSIGFLLPMIGLIGLFAFTLYQISARPVRLPWAIGLGLAFMLAVATDRLFRHRLGFPLFAETSATRFLSPTLPLLFLFMTLWAFVRMDDAIQAKDKKIKWIWLLSLCFCANFYVYFANWLILTPVAVWWLGLRWRFLWGLRRELVRPSAVCAVLMLPFLYTLLQSKINPVGLDFLQRSGQFGIVPYHTFNYPKLGPLWINLLFATGIGIGWYRICRLRHASISFRELLPLACYLISVFLAYTNYVVRDSVPQALLLHRYWVPLLVLSALALLQIAAPIDRWSALLTNPRAAFVALFMVVSGIMMLALGRFQVHQAYSGSAMEPLITTATAVGRLALPEDILVTDWQALNLLAPSYGLRTLCPNPVITYTSNADLVAHYALHNRLLGRSSAEYIRFLGNLNRFDDVHIANTTLPRYVLVQSQNSGLAYPMPPAWLEAHEREMINAYNELDIAKDISRYPSVLLCLTAGTLPVELRSVAQPLGSAASLQCWRITSPAHSLQQMPTYH